MTTNYELEHASSHCDEQAPQIWGPVVAALHPTVRRFHFDTRSLRAEGVFTVRRGRHPLARLVLGLLRMPRAGRVVPMRLRIERDGAREVWHRVFAGRTLPAEFAPTRDGRLAERLGMLELVYEVGGMSGAMRLHSVGAALRLGPMRMALPAWAAPRVRACACLHPGEAGMHASVVVFAPLAGLLLAYRGFIEEVE